MPPEKHALLSASSASRWLVCTAAPRFEEGLPESTSDYAEEGRLALCRRLYSRDLTALGPLERGEARRSFAFAAPCWRETRCPAQLFRESFFQRRLRPLGRAWWRREGELLLLALPLEPGAPFPLEALFCLGRVEQVEGTRCVVYAFREEEPAIF